GIADAAAAGLIELGLRMSDALAAGLIELGLPTSDGAALGLIASGWARGPSHRPRIMTAEKHIEAQPRLLMPPSHLDGGELRLRRLLLTEAASSGRADAQASQVLSAM
ncbi:MAG: hypothetical protein ACJ8BE_03740, partial [Microvirga sp.]